MENYFINNIIYSILIKIFIRRINFLSIHYTLLIVYIFHDKFTKRHKKTRKCQIIKYHFNILSIIFDENNIYRFF